MNECMHAWTCKIYGTGLALIVIKIGCRGPAHAPMPLLKNPGAKMHQGGGASHHRTCVKSSSGLF